jgi:hypothetical protein
MFDVALRVVNFKIIKNLTNLLYDKMKLCYDKIFLIKLKYNIWKLIRSSYFETF